ncbi:MAG: SprT-like domain-containing protein [Gammaproteobacteria bacterium]|nr:SprT-like domain-containing protein [Gammaproteobacteria bacterium]MBT8133182.1 SprT-like domain-containing protein [Gammaproteobacteria bacterium]NNJ50752.1 metallopeptidase [Gammaproteobacteria bacterium]
MEHPSSYIAPLPADKQQIVIDETRSYIKQAVDHFNIKDKTVDIRFDLKGRSAGMYRVRSKQSLIFSRQQRVIRYNPYIFSKYFDDNFATTIPHEVAHYVTDIIYGLKNIKPHGKEWRVVMDAFGADASVTANYDLAGIPMKRQAVFTYQCACRVHRLSTTRHNKIKKRRYQYTCNFCKQVLLEKHETDAVT